MDEPEYITSLEGPVELVDGQLTLRIPLDAGGAELADSARGISQIKEGELHVVIPQWLAMKLGILEGTRVVVDNHEGKFNVHPVYGPTN